MAAPSTKRRYDATRRREQARATRRRILDAAGDLFTAVGYAGTTIAELAAAAGVAPQTVYAAFGTKRAVLKELVDVRIAGDDEPVPVLERPFVRQIMAEPDGRRKLEIFARHLAEAGVLRAELTTGEAAAVISTLMDHEH